MTSPTHPRVRALSLFLLTFCCHYCDLVGDRSQFEALLQDPNGLKDKMREGMTEMKNLFSDPAKMQEMAAGLQDMLSDPAKLAEMQQAMLEGMDPTQKAAALDMAEKMAAGDYSGLTDALGDLGGGGGDMASMMEALSDPAKVRCGSVYAPG